MQNGEFYYWNSQFNIWFFDLIIDQSIFLLNCLSLSLKKSFLRLKIAVLWSIEV